MSSAGKLTLLAGISLVALSCPTMAMAQGSQSQTSESTTTNDGSFGDIIVTAQKRAENVQDVPVTVAVVSSEQLTQQNIVTTSDLVQAVPALTLTNFGVFQVRSLGTQGFGRSAEQSVSVVLDGVPMPRPQAYELVNSLFDVDHVEVLSGPQGTLFGKNATAGVISIITKAPRLGEFEAIGHVDLGNHYYRNLSAVVNAPLGENAALRVVGHHSAYGRVVFNTLFDKWDRNSDTGVRARFRWQPANTLTFDLIGDYQSLRSNGVNGIAGFAGVQVLRFVPPGSPLESTLASCGIVASPKNNKVCGDSLYDPNVDRGDVYAGRRRGVSLQADWDFAQGYTLTSISAYRHDDTGDFDVDGNFAGGFGDALPTNILQRNLFPSTMRFFSQELRVESPPTDRINFVAGLYYSKNRRRDHVDQSGGFGLLGPTLQFRRVSDVTARQYNYGAFGQVNFDVTERLRLLAGARVTRDKLRILAVNSFPNASPAGPFLYTGNKGFFSLYPISTCTLAGGDPDNPATCPAGTSLAEPARLSETGYTWKAGVQYDFSSRTMAYATFTRGYKGPFINDQASAIQVNGVGQVVPPDLLLVDSEKPDAFEVGLKTRVFDRFNLNIALFNTKAKNFQTTVFVPIEAGGGAVSSFFQGNAPFALTSGVDIGLVGNLSRNFSINANVLYNQARFNKGFLVPCNAPPQNTCEALRQLPYAPKWKSTISGEYRHDISSLIQGFVQSDLTYTSSYPYGSTPGPETFESGSRYVLGARTGLRLADDKYGIAVFCRNCLDKRYPVSSSLDGFRALDGGAGPPPAEGHFLGLSSYRLVGVTLDAKF